MTSFKNGLDQGVHVWRIELDADMVAPEAMTAMLSAAEGARADRFRFPDDRRRFLSGRVGLRQVLSHYTGVAPQDLAFEDGPHGKPALSAPDLSAPGLSAPGPLSFSFSRAGSVAVVAVAAEGQLGVDIEAIQDTADLSLVAKDHFARSERAHLASVSGDTYLAAFFRCWTGKEALIKATGDGLATDLRAFDLALSADAPLALVAGDGRYDPAQWQMRSFRPATGVAGAIAFDRPLTDVHFFDLVREKRRFSDARPHGQ